MDAADFHEAEVARSGYSEGVFYDEIDGYNLYVKHKNRKTGMLYDVLIYNFEKGFENAQIIKSDSGRLEMTADKQHLYLHLYSGEQFENLKSQNMNQKNVLSSGSVRGEACDYRIQLGFQYGGRRIYEQSVQ